MIVVERHKQNHVMKNGLNPIWQEGGGQYYYPLRIFWLYSLMQKTDTHLLLYTIANVYLFFCIRDVISYNGFIKTFNFISNGESWQKYNCFDKKILCKSLFFKNLVQDLHFWMKTKQLKWTTTLHFFIFLPHNDKRYPPQKQPNKLH